MPTRKARPPGDLSAVPPKEPFGTALDGQPCPAITSGMQWCVNGWTNGSIDADGDRDLERLDVDTLGGDENETSALVPGEFLEERVWRLLWL